MATLITGGMGFIGLHTAKAFIDAGEDVVITWFQTWREPSFIKDEYNKRVIVEKADVSEPATILDLAKKHKVSGIVHLAVPGLNALSPSDDFRTNVDGLLGVLEAAREASVARLSIASSISVYSGLKEGPFREDAPLPVRSTNPTETFKKAWEILADHYADRTGIDVVNLRMGGIYGPLYHSMANLPSRLCHAAIKGIEPDFSGSRAGAPHVADIQDLCYVKDTAKAIQLIHMAPKLEHREYNVGNGTPSTVADLISAVKKAVPGAKVQAEEGGSARARPNPYMDVSRIKNELGYQPQYTIETGVADYVGWLRENPQ